MRLLLRLAPALFAVTCQGDPGGPGTTQPAARAEHAMTWDAARGQVLLYGGASDNAFFSDLWGWDGTAWHLLADGGPPARAGAVLAYDPASHNVLLYGGVQQSGAQLTDTWQWNGTQWSQLASSGPTIRHAAGGFDVARQRLVLHRGYSGTAPQRDTWEFDGSQWSQATTATPLSYAVPLPAPMVFDTSRGALLMYIGDAGSKATSLWQWTGTQWTNLGAGPAMTTPAPVTFIGNHDLLALQADAVGASTMATWRWDGASWFAVAGTGPSKRWVGTMVYDAVRGQAVLFGGTSQATNTVLGDTWLYDVTGWHQASVP